MKLVSPLVFQDGSSLATAPTGTNTGNETATSIGTLINGATAKTTPVDADTVGVSDSAASNVLKKVTWANVKATLKTYFDTLYAVLATAQTWTAAQRGGVTALSVSTNAVAVNLALANNFSLTLQATTAQTLSNPTNAVAGQSGQIAILQNATPSTLAYGTSWVPYDGVTPTVSTTASAQNLLTYYVVDSTHVWFSLAKHGVT